MLTVRQVADRLNVSPSTVYDLVESGELSHYRIKSAIRVSDDQIAEYLERQKQEGPPLIEAALPKQKKPEQPVLKHLTLKRPG